jgi:hypothetical protein
MEEFGPGLKVGIAWRGGLLRTGRVLRSLQLTELRPLLETPHVHWISLQHARASGGDEELSEAGITAWDDVLTDIDETAALTTALDLVVTVCSTVVHLTGALGRPVWVLTPKAPAWRYLMEGERLPWYPNARLFRQREASRWDEVIAHVAHELRQLTNSVR